MLAVGKALRVHLEPLWVKLHKSDVRWGRAGAEPEIVSQGMCRHAAEFGVRALKQGGVDGWRLRQGSVSAEAMLRRPCCVPAGADGALHYWMERADGAVLDITADQFGLEEVLFRDGREDLPEGWRRDDRVQRRNLVGTILNWEGNPKGSWMDWELEPVRLSYGRLIGQLVELAGSAEQAA